MPIQRCKRCEKLTEGLRWGICMNCYAFECAIKMEDDSIDWEHTTHTGSMEEKRHLIYCLNDLRKKNRAKYNTFRKEIKEKFKSIYKQYRGEYNEFK